MRKLHLLYVLFMVLEYIPDVILESVESLGCWKDSQRKRALQSLENSHLFLVGDYKKRKEPIKKCAQVANDHGYLVFALQNGGECLSGPTAERRFSMYGPSQTCKDGKGGSWSSSVYTYLPTDPRTRASVLGTRRGRVFAAMMNKIPRRQILFNLNQPYRGPIISPPRLIRTNVSMIGTQRNKVLKLNKTPSRQLSRVPHQALHGPIKARHRIQVARARAQHQAQRGAVKSRIWTQVPRGSHQVLRSPIKSRIWAQGLRRPRQALRGPIKSKFRAQQPRGPPRAPIKSAFRKQLARDPHKALRNTFKMGRRTKVNNVLGTRRNRVMAIINKYPRRLSAHARVPHQLLRDPIMLARRFRTKANVLGMRRNRVMSMMNKFSHRLMPGLPRQFLRNPEMLTRRFRPDNAPGSSRSLHESMDPTPWDPYCSRDLDIVVLMDGSGSTTRRNRARWDEMKEFVVSFAKGFDEHSRLGVIGFGEDSEIIADVHKGYKAEAIEERLKNIDMPGGRRGLNEALKTAWREQLKQSNRSSADKIIIALTTGDLASGLYGSTQFLTEHNIRVIAVGIDKDPHYEFLQSIASYRDVSNVFSVNSENLLDAAPYMYRDVCNNVQLESPKSNKRTVYDMLHLKALSARTNHALGMALGIAQHSKRFPINAFSSRAVPLHGEQYNLQLRPHQPFLSPPTTYGARGDLFTNKVVRNDGRYLPIMRPYQRGVAGNKDAVNRYLAMRQHNMNMYNLHRRFPIRKYNLNINRFRKPFINPPKGIQLVKNALPRPNMENMKHFPPPITDQMHNLNRNFLARQQLAKGNIVPPRAVNFITLKQHKERPIVPANRFHQDHDKDFKSQGNVRLHNLRYSVHEDNGRQAANIIKTSTVERKNDHVATTGSVHVPERKHLAGAVLAGKNKKAGLNVEAAPNGVKVIPDNHDIVISGKNVKAITNQMHNEAAKQKENKVTHLRRDGAPTIDDMKKGHASTGVHILPDDEDVVVTGKGIKTNPINKEEGGNTKQNGKQEVHLRSDNARPVHVNVIHTGKDTNYHLHLPSLKKSSAPLVDEDIQDQEDFTRQRASKDIARKTSGIKEMPKDIAKKTSGIKEMLAKNANSIRGMQQTKSTPLGQPSPMGQEILKTAATPVLIDQDELNHYILPSEAYDNNDKRTLGKRKHRKANVTAHRRHMKVANTSMPEYVSETTPPPTKASTATTPTPTTTPTTTTTTTTATTTTPKKTVDAKPSKNKSAGNSSTRNKVPKENSPSNVEGKGNKQQDAISSFNGVASDLSSEPTVLLNPSPEAPQKDKAGRVLNKPSAVEDNSNNTKSVAEPKDDDDEDKFYEKQAQKGMHQEQEKPHNGTKDDDDDENIRTFHDMNNSRSLEHSDHHVPTEDKLNSNDENLYKLHLGMPLSLTDKEDSDTSADSEVANKILKEPKPTDDSKMVNEVEDTGVSRSAIYKSRKTEYRANNNNNNNNHIKETVGTAKGNIVEPLLVSNQTKIESAKEGETTLNGVGALSQTIEYHVGSNNTLHVSNHTHPHGLNIHQSIFSGKLHDRISHFPALKPLALFHRPHDVFESKELYEQQVRSTLHYPQKKVNTNKFITIAGEELENLFSKNIRGDKRTIDEISSAMKIPKRKIGHMGSRFGRAGLVRVDLPDEADSDELQRLKVDKILDHFTGAKRNYNEITTFTEVPYYRAIKRMFYSLMNHERGLSKSLRPEQIRRISILANQMKGNHPVRGSKRNESSNDMSIFNDEYLGDPKSVTFPGSVTLGEDSFNEGQIYEPGVEYGVDMNMNRENLDTMRTEMMEEDMPPPLSFTHMLSKHSRHKKHKATSMEDEELEPAENPITTELVKEQTRLTRPQGATNEEQSATGGTTEQEDKHKEDKHDEEEDMEDENAKLLATLKSKQKESQQRDSAHDSITPTLIKEQTKLTEPQEPAYEERNEKGNKGKKGKKTDANSVKELNTVELISPANETVMENKTKEDAKMYTEKEIEELGKEYQSNEILLKNDEKKSNGANSATSEDKKNIGKSDSDIEAENKVILTKILGLIHQIKPLHFGDNVTAGKIEEIAFHNNLNSYFHNAFDTLDAKDIHSGNKVRAPRCPLNSLCTDTEDAPLKGKGSVPIIGNSNKTVGVQGKRGGALGAQRGGMKGAKKENIVYADGEVERAQESNLVQLDPLDNFRESVSKKKNGIHLPDSPNVPADQPHMSALKPIGHIHPPMFRPRHPVATPEHPPGFKSLFEHVDKKNSVSDDSSIMKDLNENKEKTGDSGSAVSHAREGASYGTENARKKTLVDNNQPLIHNNLGGLHGRTKFFPQKKAIFYDVLAPSKRTETRLNDTLENIYRAINQGNNDVIMHQLETLAQQRKSANLEANDKNIFGLKTFVGKEKGDNEDIMHELEKLATQRKELKLEGFGKNSENQNTDNGAIINQLEKLVKKSDQFDKNNGQSAIMQQLRKLALQKKKYKVEGSDKAMLSKYHGSEDLRKGFVLGNKKHTLEGKYADTMLAPRSPAKPTFNKPMNENSVKNNVFDMMDLNDQDLSTLQPSAQPPSSAQASKKETMGSMVKEEPRRSHEVQYLPKDMKEDDFPRSFPYNSFSLSDLPKLPMEKSYVISPPHAGNVVVSIRESNLNDNEGHFVNEGGDLLSNDDIMARANHEISKVDSLAKSIEKLEKQDEKLFVPPEVERTHDGISGKKDLHGFSPSSEPHTLAGLTNEIETRKITLDGAKEPTSILAYTENPQKRNVTTKGLYEEVFPITQMLNADQGPLALSSLLPEKDERLEMGGSEIVSNFRNNIGNRHLYGDTQKVFSPWKGLPQLSPRHEIGENSSSSPASAKLVNEISDLLRNSIDIRTNKGNDTSPQSNVKLTPAQKNESTNTNTSLNNKDLSNSTETAGVAAGSKVEGNDTAHINEPVNTGTINETMINAENKNFLNQSSEGPKVNDIKSQTTNDTKEQARLVLPGTIFNSTENAGKGMNMNGASSRSNFTVNTDNAAVENSSVSNETSHIELTKNSYTKHPPKYKSKAYQNALHNKGIGVSLSHLQVPPNSDAPEKASKSKHVKSLPKDTKDTSDESPPSFVVKERTKPKITVIKIINIPNPNKASEDNIPNSNKASEDGSEEIYGKLRRNDTMDGEPNTASNETVSEEQKQEIEHGKTNLMDNPTNVTSSIKVVDAAMEGKHKIKVSNDMFNLDSLHPGATLVNDSSLVDYNDIAPQLENRVGGEPSKENSVAGGVHNRNTVNESMDANEINHFPNEEKSENTTTNEMQSQSQNPSHEIKAPINESSSTQNESQAILPLQDYKNDSYKTNITSFKLLDNKDVQKTKNLLDNADTSGIFGKGVAKEMAQNTSTLDDVKKVNDFPFIRPTENNESLKTISSVHDKKDSFELKPFNDIEGATKEHGISPSNDTYGKHMIELQKAREVPYNYDDRHLDDLKMVRDSPLNEEKPTYPKEEDLTNSRSSSENSAHRLLQNPSPVNPKIRIEHNDVEPVDEHHEPGTGNREPNLLLQNPSPGNTKENGEYHQVSEEPSQVSTELRVTTPEHHEGLTDHHEPTQEHHEMTSEHHEPEPEHHEVTTEHHEHQPEHHEVTSEHHEPPLEHHEVILEHYGPEKEHHELTSEPHEPSHEHHELISEHHEPSLEHHDVASEHHEPEPEHHDTTSEHHEPAPEHHEMILQHHEPEKEHHELTSEQHEPTQEHHEMTSEHHEGTQNHHELTGEEHHQVSPEHPEVATENHEATSDRHETPAEHHETPSEHQASSHEESHKDTETTRSPEGNSSSSFVVVSEKTYNKTQKELQESMPAFNNTKVSLLQNNTYKVGNGSKEKYPNPKTFTEFINDLNSTSNLVGDEGDNSTAHKNESVVFQNGLAFTNLESNSTLGNFTNSTVDESNISSRHDLSNVSMHDNNIGEGELKNRTDEQGTHLTDYAAIFTNKSTGGGAPHAKEENGDNVEFNNLEFAAGCSMPLRVVYAIDVSEGLGSGLERGKKWNKLNNFINKISKGFASGVTQKFMVYNVEPRFLKELSGCDEDTEYFTLADDCLCDARSRIDNPNGCSVNAPLHTESIEDWGLQGPRTGLALKRVHDYFRANRSLTKFKNLVILVSYQDSADDISEAERSLKRDGISLVNIDFGLHTSSLKRRDYINPAPQWGSRHITENPVFRFKRNRIEDTIPKEHKFKVSFKSFRNSLGKIIKKVCKAEPGKRRSQIGNNIRKSNIAFLGHDKKSNISKFRVVI